MTEVEKWVSYTYRLIAQGKRGTPEFLAVQERAIAALKATEISSQSVPTPPRRTRASHATSSAPVPVKKRVHRRPTGDSAKDWQTYLDALALVGEEDSAEYQMGRYRLEVARRAKRESLKMRELSGILPLQNVIVWDGAKAHLAGWMGWDYTHALNSAGGYGDSESPRQCRRCKVRFVRDSTDPGRCANCFAPKHSLLELVENS